MNKVVLVLAGAAVLVALFLVLRPDEDGNDEVATPPPPPTKTTTGTTTTTPTRTTTTRPAPAGPTPIRIVVRNGRVVGGLERARLDRGERAVLIVRSDVSDHVHLHGYDIMRDVAPGAPARLRFRATIPGRFEVELEDRGLQIAQIEVRP